MAEGAETAEAAAAEASALVGARLDDIAGSTVGRIDGVLADARSGVPSWLVVRLGRFGRRGSVPYAYVVPGIGRAWVPFSRETIRSSAELDPSAGLSIADERVLCDHYGVPAGSGRDAELAGRGEGDPGSVAIQI